MPGRPRKPDAKRHRIVLAVSLGEKRAFVAEAAALKISVQALIRRKLQLAPSDYPSRAIQTPRVDYPEL